MSVSDDIRKAIEAARPKASPTNPFAEVLKEVAKGISSDTVLATFSPRSGSRWTLRIAPAHQPANAQIMLEVVALPNRAEVLLDPKCEAQTPAQLAEILKEFVTIPEFIESLDIIGQRSQETVSGFLRVTRGSPSRDDVMVDVPPDVQKSIGTKKPDEAIACKLSVSSVPGAGKFRRRIRYTILESAGLFVDVHKAVAREGHIELKGSKAT